MKVKKNSYKDQEGFLLLKPKMLDDSDKVAKAIAMCKGVKKVFLTSGDYAFVVSINAPGNKDIAKIRTSIKSIVKRVVINTAVSHYLYKC
ncbi:MAG: Lrp/AsnC ligand binding domain-containing protein [Candidatus Micrarchaeales archaeon]